MDPVAITLFDEFSRQTAHDALDAVDLGTGAPPRMVLESSHESPTDRQRGYYRAVVVKELCEYTGYSEKVMHVFLLAEHGPKVKKPEEVWIGGICHQVSTFTTSNIGTIGEMAKYLDEILRWAAVSLDLYISEPDEDWMRTPPPELEEEAVAA